MDIYKVLHEVQHERKKSDIFSTSPLGGLAQLGERLHGMQEVSGSIPLSSTKIRSLSSRGLGHDPFTVGTGVRIPVGTPRYKARQVSACRAFGYLEKGRWIKEKR